RTCLPWEVDPVRKFGRTLPRISGPKLSRSKNLAWCVMAVDPDSVMVMPAPMSRNPNPIDPADVVARSMDIIRPVTDFDVHNDSICHGCHRCQHCQKYSNFSFHTRNSYWIKTNTGRLLFGPKPVARLPGKSAIDVVTRGTGSRISADDV